MKTFQSGVTLVELMVTIAILAILAGVAAPSLSHLMMTNRLASQTNGIMAALTVARAEAIRRNQRVVACRYDGIAANGSVPATFSCDAGGGDWTGVVVFNDSNANNARDAGEDLIKAERFDTSKTAIRASAQIAALSNAVVFRGDGIARDNTGAFLNSGQIRVCIPDTGGNNARDIALRGGGKTVLSKASDNTCGAPND